MSWIMGVVLVFSILPIFCLTRFTKVIYRQRTEQGFKHLIKASQIWEHPTATIEVTQLVSEVHRLYPKDTIRNGALVDGWNHPVAVTVEVLPNLTKLKLKSAGADGVWGSEDDLVQEAVIARR